MKTTMPFPPEPNCNMEHDAMKQALSGFLSSDKTVRDSSNEMLVSLPFQVTLPFLSEELNDRRNNDVEVRRLCGVLLRKLLLQYSSALHWEQASSSPVHSLEGTTKANVAEEVKRVVGLGLMQALEDEQLGVVVYDGMEALVKLYKEPSDWATPWEWLSVRGPCDNAYFQMVCRLSNCGPRALDVLARPEIRLLPQLRAGLENRDDAIRLGALRAATACIRNFVTSGSTSGLVKELLELSDPILECCLADGAEEQLQCLLEITEDTPKLWRSDAIDLLQRMALMAQQSQFTVESRILAVRVMVAFLVHAPKWCKQNPQTVAHVLETLFATACDPTRNQSDQEFDLRREEESARDEDGTIHQVGVDGLLEILEKLDAGSFLEVATRLATKVLHDPASPWNKLAAALILLNVISETSKPEGVALISTAFLSLLVKFTRHANSRVRLSALSVLATVIEKLGPDPLAEKTRELLTALVQTVQTDDAPRCRCRALTCICLWMSELVENDEGESAGHEPCKRWLLLEPFVRDLLEHAIIPSVEHSIIPVKELGLATASMLAQCCGHKFTPYYDLFMTAARNIITTAGTDDLRILGDSAIEMAGQLCVSVGPEKFANDVDWLMSALMRIIADELPTDGSAALTTPFRFTASVLTSLARMAETLGQHFLPYLDPVVARVLPAALQTADVCISEDTGAALTAGCSPNRRRLQWTEQGGRTTVEFRDAAGSLQSLSINTGAIEEKKACVNLLSILCSKFKREFSKYASSCCELLQRDMNATLKSIRDIAFESHAGFLESLMWDESAANPHTSLYTKTLSIVLPIITAAMAQRKTEEVATSVLQGLRDVLTTLDNPYPGQVKKVGQIFIPKENVTQMLNGLFEALGRILLSTLTEEISEEAEKEKANESAKESNADEDDWEVVSNDDDGEVDTPGLVYDGVMHCATSLLHVYGEGCATLFETHLNMPFRSLLSYEGANKLGKVAALCAFAEAINCGGSELAERYARHYLPFAMLHGIVPEGNYDDDDEDNDIMRIQAAAFGIGVVAERQPLLFAPKLVESYKILGLILTHPRAKSKERRKAADCAVSALLKIYATHFDNAQLRAFAARDLGEIFGELVISWFPLEQDNDEQLAAHHLILLLLQQNHALTHDLATQKKFQLMTILKKIEAEEEMLLEEDRQVLLPQVLQKFVV